MEMFFHKDERGKEENKLLIWMFKLMVRRLLITEPKLERMCQRAHPLFIWPNATVSAKTILTHSDGILCILEKNDYLRMQ